MLVAAVETGGFCLMADYQSANMSAAAVAEDSTDTGLALPPRLPADRVKTRLYRPISQSGDGEIY